MSDKDDLILLTLLRLLVKDDKLTELIEDSKRSRIYSVPYMVIYSVFLKSYRNFIFL